MDINRKSLSSSVCKRALGELVTEGKWKGWIREEYSKEHWQQRIDELQEYIYESSKEIWEMAKDYENMPECDRIGMELEIYRNRLYLYAILNKLSKES